MIRKLSCTNSFSLSDSHSLPESNQFALSIIQIQSSIGIEKKRQSYHYLRTKQTTHIQNGGRIFGWTSRVPEEQMHGPRARCWTRQKCLPGNTPLSALLVVGRFKIFFGCVLASLSEGVSFRRSVGWSVRPSHTS